jgi:hypothetical protein
MKLALMALCVLMASVAIAPEANTKLKGKLDKRADWCISR